MQSIYPDAIEVKGPELPGGQQVLTPEALAFLGELHRRFNERRLQLLDARTERQVAWDGGSLPGFLDETASIREDKSWRVAPVPSQLQDRRVEITGPVDRKMVINALNSGAKVFMADFEDSNSPTWENCISGQANLIDAVRGVIDLVTEKKTYSLDDMPARLMVRPRGWHLDEPHLLVDGQPMSASLFDFGLFVWHNAGEQISQSEVPAFYLPKLEHYTEAALWDDVFSFCEDALELGHGTLKATVLLETFPAVFQIEEILWSLRDHIIGINAGRWDFIFSAIKTFRNHPDRVLPDRAEIGMTTPFMRAYTELLVATCHKRGAFAMGGMSAFIPDRRDPEVTENAMEQVKTDKIREASDGFDGTWVAHPDLVPLALEIFTSVLGGAPNQATRLRPEVQVDDLDLLDFEIPGSTISAVGLHNNIEVGLQYIESWLNGRGAVGINNLMEDAATAEISRSQIWQWVRHGANLDDGRTITAELVRREIDQVTMELVADRGNENKFAQAAELFLAVALEDTFPPFLTVPAYDVLCPETVT